MEEIIDTESYRKKKDELLQQKNLLQEKIEEIKTKSSSWLEPIRELINVAINCEKIARATSNVAGTFDVAQKIA